MGCTICGSSVKNPNTKSHIKSKGHQNALEKGTRPSSGGIARPVSTGRESMSSVDINRINDLEKQMHYVMDKLRNLENKLNSGPSKVISSNVHNQIKSDILRMTQRGTSMSLDDLARKLSRYSWNAVEGTLLELIDDEYFDVTESYSKKKINGRYGRIIRR